MKTLLTKMGIHDRISFFLFVKQFLRFGIIGLCNTLLSLLIYYLFIHINSDLYIMGNVIAWIITVANSFILNKRFVFRDSNTPFFNGMLKAYTSYGGSLLLGTFLLFLQVELLGIPKELAPIINIFITTPMNFLINKFWTFGK